MQDGFSNPATTSLAPGFPFPALLPFPCPRSSDNKGVQESFTCCPSDTHLCLSLSTRLTQSRSALLWKPWIFFTARIPTLLSLLIPAFSLLSSPHPLPVMLPSPKNAPLPTLTSSAASVWVFQPRTFSAQDLSTSELLRTLLMNGCF